MLEGKLRDAQFQIEELKRRNKALEAFERKCKGYWKQGHGDVKVWR